jgi:hypothetical protein
VCFLSAGDRAMLWLGPIPEDKLPKDAQGEDGFLGVHTSMQGLFWVYLCSVGNRAMLWLGHGLSIWMPCMRVGESCVLPVCW